MVRVGINNLGVQNIYGSLSVLSTVQLKPYLDGFREGKKQHTAWYTKAVFGWLLRTKNSVRPDVSLYTKDWLTW